MFSFVLPLSIKGLRKKRAMISSSTSTLSQLLREAKEIAKEKQVCINIHNRHLS